MGNNNVDEKILKWSEIFESLIIDARMLTEDLLGSVNYVGASGVIVIALGFVFLMYNISQFWRGELFVFTVLICTGLDFFFGLWNIWKFLQLRRKYHKLYELQKEMEPK